MRARYGRYGVRIDQLAGKRIDCIAVAAPGAPLVETIDEEHFTSVEREGEK